MSENFDNAISGLSGQLFKILNNIPKEIKANIQEIRVRANMPLIVNANGSTYFIDNNSRLECSLRNSIFIVSKYDVEDSFKKLCEYSIYSHQEEIKNGFITAKGGHRVGICGTAVYDGDSMNSLRDITSLNIRIARQIRCTKKELISEIVNSSNGVLIVGAPSCGKTTLLRDIARSLSTGEHVDMKKVSVIDERGEISGTCRGIRQNDVGFSDVLNGYSKGKGILQAIRVLSPEFIICDELGGVEDIKSVEEGLNAGVKIIASIHASSIDELIHRKQAKMLLQTGAFEKIILMEQSPKFGQIKGIYKVGDLNVEDDRFNDADHDRKSDRLCSVQ